MVTTRTIGPLHLEDLEPHRFEDLVRQLIYDFRNWRRLEATGRGGSDDGFDARGIEAVGGVRSSVSDEDADSAEDETEAKELVWLIQCKREKSIPPAKLGRFLSDISPDERESLHGMIFVAACDFSKKAHDTFRDWIGAAGLAEAYLWGKGELEDMLFQPKNDHLLFAYFGISLQSRRRSVRTAIRQRLAAKKKAQSLEDYVPVLLRDATDDRYPYLDEDQQQKERIDRGRWTVLRYAGCFHDGLHFVVERHFAFLDDDGRSWDFAECMDDGPVGSFENPWKESPDSESSDERLAAMAIWDGIPQPNKAWFEVIAVLPFDAVLEIDDSGDDRFEGPHIYTSEFTREKGPFRYFIDRIETTSQWGGRTIYPDEADRIAKFPRTGDQ